MPYLRYNPKEPGDRESAFVDYFLGLIVFWGSLGSIIYYVCSLVSLFIGNYSAHILFSSGALIVMAILDFLIIVFAFSKMKGDIIKETAKRFFLFFFLGSIDLAGIVALFVAFYTLARQGNGTILLICSIVVVLSATFAIFVFHRKINGCGPLSIKLFTDEKNLKNYCPRNFPKKRTCCSEKNKQTFSRAVQDSDCIFCHKCGMKLSEDSVFCSTCGTKLK